MTQLVYRSVLAPVGREGAAASRDVDALHKWILSGGFNHVTVPSDTTVRQHAGVLFLPVTDQQRRHSASPRRPGSYSPNTRPGPLRMVVVQSVVQPQWSKLPPWLRSVGVDVVDVEREEGTTIRYEGVFNPSRANGAPEPGQQGARGPVMPLVTKVDSMEWWERQAEKAGLELDPDRRVISEFPVVFSSPRRKNLVVTSRRFAGVAKVRNSAALLAASIGGIGKGKAFGMGMLISSSV